MTFPNNSEQAMRAMTESMYRKHYLQQRKAAIRARMDHSRTLIRQDINDLREELNPLKTIGQLVGSMLQPAPDAKISDSGILNFGVDTGISLLINRFIPAHSRNIATVLAPVLVKNLMTHFGPQLRSAAEKALEWVVEKTAEKSGENPSDREVQTETDPVAG